MDRFQIVGTLGQGSFGTVHEVVAADGTHYAMKIVRLANATKYLEAEVLNHANLVHPHIVQLREWFRTHDTLCIVMELANGGSLFELVKRQKLFPECTARWFFQQLVFAVDFCHKRGVANRDIKLENLLLHSEPEVPDPILKMCDFGYSKAYRWSTPKTRVGTLSYMAPEVVRNCVRREYDALLADVWSCGVVLYIMLYGCYPFDRWSVDQGVSEAEKMRRMVDRMQAEAYRLNPDVPVSEEGVELLRGLLKPDPAQRFTMERVMEHAWFHRDLPPLAMGMNGFYLQRGYELDCARFLEQQQQILSERQGQIQMAEELQQQRQPLLMRQHQIQLSGELQRRQQQQPLLVRQQQIQLSEELQQEIEMLDFDELPEFEHSP